jgi:hypothetical protein
VCWFSTPFFKSVHLTGFLNLVANQSMLETAHVYNRFVQSCPPFRLWGVGVDLYKFIDLNSLRIKIHVKRVHVKRRPKIWILTSSFNTVKFNFPQFVVIYCNLFCFSVGINNLLANIAKKRSFLYLLYSTAFIVLQLSYSFIILWMIPNIQNGLKEWKQ